MEKQKHHSETMSKVPSGPRNDADPHIHREDPGILRTAGERLRLVDIENLRDREQLKLLKGVGSGKNDSFGPEELDPYAIMEKAVRDGTYKVVAAVDERGAVVGCITSSTLPFFDEHWKEQGDEVYNCLCYIAVKPEYQRKHVATAMEKQMTQRAEEEAAGKGKKLVGWLAEASNKELFWNKLNSDRLYVQTGEYDFEEIQYYQPPTDWDREGNGIQYDERDRPEPFVWDSAPEHLVFSAGGRYTLTPHRLMAMVRSMFSYNSAENLSPRAGRAARQNMQATVREYERKLLSQMARSVDGKIHRISWEEQKNMKRRGCAFKLHEKPASLSEKKDRGNEAA